MYTSEITIGADPELFLINPDNNTLVSAIDKFGGTKDIPVPLGIGDGYNVLEDNVMVEFNIPPAFTADRFVEHIQKSLNKIEQKANAMGYDLSTLASGHFSLSELEDWRSWVFGCDPDYNAYTQKKNPSPSVESDPEFRTCGGHVHVGVEELKEAPFEEVCRAVAFCDLHLGIPSMYFDKDTKRRERYGKAGAFRVKPYGFEYRTLSNFWIFHTDLIKWVYYATQQAVKHYRSGFDLTPYYDDLQKAINENDKSAQEFLIRQFNLVV